MRKTQNADVLALFPEDREKDAQDQERKRLSMIFGTPEFRVAYRNYINSSAWKKLCKKVLERTEGRCQRCGLRPVRIEIHHLTYERFQNERLEDLEALCTVCHEAADREREEDNRRRFEEAGEEARYENARETYMTKKYGENWYMYYGESEHEEFDNWMEKKREQEW
jgi:5-methylcytosine-specific restriction endonuclease McrA